MKGTCDKCCFWDYMTGRCHRHAPRPSTPNEAMSAGVDESKGGTWWENDLSVWPITDAHDWCGEWKIRATT